MLCMRAVLPILYLQSALLAGLAVPAARAASDPDLAGAAEDLLFASPTRIDHIGRVIAPVMIDGKGPYRFIIDTGASHTTISPKLAAALGLESTGEPLLVEVHGITGSAQVPSVHVRKLEAGSLVIENSRLPVIWAPLMAGADGILGVAGLKDECIFVDFRGNRVVISRCRGTGAWRGSTRVPAIRLNGGLITVAAKIGGVRVQAVIDTGSERTLGNMALRNALYGQPRVGSIPRLTHVYGATTEVSAGEMQIAPTIALGSMRVADVTVVYGDFHIFEVWGMQARPAVIIGMDVLGTVRSLGIDFRRPEIYIEPARYLDPEAMISISAGK